MTYAIEIWTGLKTGWKKLKPTHGNPYLFDTKEKAIETTNICYPDSFGENIRIVEVE